MRVEGVLAEAGRTVNAEFAPGRTVRLACQVDDYFSCTSVTLSIRQTTSWKSSLVEYSQPIR